MDIYISNTVLSHDQGEKNSSWIWFFNSNVPHEVPTFCQCLCCFCWKERGVFFMWCAFVCVISSCFFFSTSAALEIYSLNLAEATLEMPLVSSIPSQCRWEWENNSGYRSVSMLESAPSYLCDTVRLDSLSHTLHSTSDTFCLRIPCSKLSAIDSRSFSVFRPSAWKWNKLPLSLCH